MSRRLVRGPFPGSFPLSRVTTCRPLSGFKPSTFTNRFSTTRHTRSDSPSSTTKPSLSATEAASQLLTTHSATTPVSRKQYLDGNQLQRLSLTLGRRNLYPPKSDDSPSDPALQDLTSLSATPVHGTPLPPGYHLVYFTPGGLESELGPDGTDRTFNAPAPFTRRMWAGGKMTWFDRDDTRGLSQVGGRGPRRLKVGEIAEEKTKLVGAKAKKSRDGSEMVLVDVEKEFWGEDGLVCVDQRSWIFRPELDAANSTKEVVTETKVIRGPSTVRDVIVGGQDLPQRHHTWSPTALFRFSALTFNGHKIHYDQSWSRAIENHPSPSVVVHGPLNLLCMLDFFRDVVIAPSSLPMHKSAGSTEKLLSGQKGGRKEGLESATRIREIEYRALSPLYAGQEYSIRAEYRTPEAIRGKGEKDDDGGSRQVWDVYVERGDTLCMKAAITTAGP